VALAFAFSPAEMLEAELARFPPPDVVKATLTFANLHFKWIYWQSKNDPDSVPLFEWKIECYYFAKSWERLSDAQDAKNPLSTRMGNMLLLKQTLGLRDWSQGRMPSPPLHRFREGKPTPLDLKLLSSLLKDKVPRS
jgi:hypothetical protein